MDHFLLYCEMASSLWNIFSLIGLAWVMPSQVAELFSYLKRQFRGLRNVEMLKIIPSCLMYCLWWKRDDWSFEDHEQAIEEFKDFFFMTLY